MAFLPDDYDVPKKGSNYVQLEQGDNRLRILDSPVLGWIGWVENEDGWQPMRFPMDERPENLSNFRDNQVNHFWAMPAWNYDQGRIQIWEITQSTIMKPLKNYAENPDWGAPTNYDITVHKEGEKLDTEYSVMPDPNKTKISEEVRNRYSRVDIDLEALFEGEDPFDGERDTPQAPPKQGKPQSKKSDTPPADAYEGDVPNNPWENEDE